MKKQGKTEKLLQSRKAQAETTTSVNSELDSGQKTEKISKETDQIKIKIHLQLLAIHQCWHHSLGKCTSGINQ